jgi:hypothetical protein
VLSFCSGLSDEHEDQRILHLLPWRHGVAVEHDHRGGGMIVTTNGGVLLNFKIIGLERLHAIG